MKTQTIARASMIFGTALGLLVTVTGQSQEKVTWVRIDLYNDGNAAFTKGDAIPALEKLFAFREFNKQQLESAKSGEDQKVRDDLDRAIQVLEASLARAR